MDKLFPISDRVKSKDLISLIVAILIYIVIAVVLDIVAFLFGWIPFFGGLIRLVIGIINLYCFIGIVIAIYRFFK